VFNMKIVLLMLFTSILAACGESSSGQANSTNSAAALPAAILTPSVFATPSARQSANAQPVPVTLTYTIPLHPSTAPPTLTAQGRSALANSTYTGYTSTAAPISISVNVTPLNGSTSNYTGSCTADPSGNSGTCTVAFTAAPGATTISGTLSEASNVIANFSNVSIIQPGTSNSINFTANPVVSSVTLQLGATTVNAGIATNIALIINAKDANGRTIAGTAPYEDANGNPVVLSLNVRNNQAGGQGSANLLGPSIITMPGQPATSVHYDGNWLSSATISATTTSSIVPTPLPVTFTTIPQAYE
jgi:hypothetical protein